MEENTQEVQKESTQSTVGDEKLFGALSYLWLLSVIIYLLKKDDQFVRFHARQGIVLFIFSLVLWVFWFIPFIGWLINLAMWAAIFFGAYKAFMGEKYKFPVVSDVADKLNL